MNLNDYQTAALRSAHHGSAPNMRLAVAGLGLSGEAAEVLDLLEQTSTPPQDKLIKELGDVMWYCAEIATLTELSLGEVHIPQGGHHGAVRLMIKAGLLTDYLKKVVGHGHQIDRARVREGLSAVLQCVADVAAAGGTDLPTVCEQNVAKLRARYPEGFEAKRSIERAD